MTQKTIPAPYEHQKAVVDFGMQHSPCRIFNDSDPGTGKTRATLDLFSAKNGKCALVLAPLSILQPAWGNDIEAYLPGVNYVIAHGTPAKRKKLFLSGARIIITNHDAVNWIIKDKEMMGYVRDNVDWLIIDEYTAFRNRTTIRSKAVEHLSRTIANAVLLSGTPIPRTVLDKWFVSYLLDNGQRLGSRFFQFRSQVCEPTQVGPDANMLRWDDKPGAAEAVADALKDITIRFKLEDCISMPPNVQHDMLLDPPDWLMQRYHELERTSMLELESGTLSPVHASARIKKMLQLLSGAVYNENGDVLKVHDERYDLITQLICERQHCVVGYNWTHELERLVEHAKHHDLRYAYINGSVPMQERTRIVERFQAGELDVVYAHPQSAGHGLTLTRGDATIWSSPTYNGEHYKQLNHRIYRAGQTKRTETIRVAYRGTCELEVYEKLDVKLDRQDDLLHLLATFTKNHEVPRP